jgi:hypothetical protein
MGNEEVKQVVASYTSAKTKLKILAPTFNWGNLLGDYGEYLSIEHYRFEQATAGTKGYDATNKEGKTVQIKTVRETTKSIKFSTGADYLLVIEVNENADWDEVYFGNFDKVRKASYKGKTGEYTIGISKLRKISDKTYRPKEDISVTLKNGSIVTAKTRTELRDKLIEKKYKVPGMSTVNTRIDNDWELERAFGIKVPPNYASDEGFVEAEGYEWFPMTPTQDRDRIPVVYHPEKRVYISQKLFCKEKEITDETYLSEKLKDGWDLSRIVNSYSEMKKKLRSV